MIYSSHDIHLPSALLVFDSCLCSARIVQKQLGSRAPKAVESRHMRCMWRREGILLDLTMGQWEEGAVPLSSQILICLFATQAEHEYNRFLISKRRTFVNC